MVMIAGVPELGVEVEYGIPLGAADAYQVPPPGTSVRDWAVAQIRAGARVCRRHVISPGEWEQEGRAASRRSIRLGEWKEVGLEEALAIAY